MFVAPLGWRALLEYRTRAEARANIFNYIERFHNLRKRQRLEMLKENDLVLTQLPVKSG